MDSVPSSCIELKHTDPLGVTDKAVSMHNRLNYRLIFRSFIKSSLYSILFPALTFASEYAAEGLFSLLGAIRTQQHSAYFELVTAKGSQRR